MPVCEVDQISEPEVNPFEPLICDVSDTSACDSVVFTGTGFSTDDTYTCGVVSYEVTS